MPIGIYTYIYVCMCVWFYIYQPPPLWAGCNAELSFLSRVNLIWIQSFSSNPNPNFSKQG